MTTKHLLALLLIGIVAIFATGCGGPEGGSNETDKRYIDGKPADPNAGDMAPGQARRAAAQKGP